MNEPKIIEYITEIIDNLSSKEELLENTLRKTLILGSFLKNEKLKSWSKQELNGYKNRKLVPNYRRLLFEVRCDIEVIDSGFAFSENNRRIPVELLDDYKKTGFHETYPLTKTIAELIFLSKNDLVVTLPAQMIHPLQVLVKRGTIKKVWVRILRSSVIGMFSVIKNTLLELMLELNEEVNNGKSLIGMSKKGDIDTIINKTVGNLTTDTINFNNSNVIVGESGNIFTSNSK